MLFTKAGRVIAWLAISLGGLRVVTGLLVALSDDPASAARSLLGSKSSGEAIDQGIYAIVFGIGFGILTEISRSLASKKAERTAEE